MTYKGGDKPKAVSVFPKHEAVMEKLRHWKLLLLQHKLHDPQTIWNLANLLTMIFFAFLVCIIAGAFVLLYYSPARIYHHRTQLGRSQL